MEYYEDICQAIRDKNKNRFQTLLDKPDAFEKLLTLEDLVDKNCPHGKLPMDQSPVHVAVQEGAEDFLKLLIRNGAQTNVKAYSSSEHCEIPLQTAIFARNADIVTLLLKKGSDTTVIEGSRENFLQDSAQNSETWAQNIQDGKEKKEILRIFKMYNAEKNRTRYFCFFMLLFFIVGPVVSFLFFSFINRHF